MKKIGTSTIALEHGDITLVVTDAIVNAANSRLAGGGGVDGAIHRAGGPAILEECRRIGGCATGAAVITGAGNLRAKHVIHAVAPRYSGHPDDAKHLASAYARSLELAERHTLTSIAFPSLGTGAYGYPIEHAARIALATTVAHLKAGSRIERVTFVLFSRGDLLVYESALAALTE